MVQTTEGVMTRSLYSLESKALDRREPTKLLTIEECQSIGSPLREELELLDYEIRSAFARILSDVDRSGPDNILFLKASTTVLLSIAAGLMERAAEQNNAPFDVKSFVVGAEMAVEWAKMRKLRYFLGGEA
jgi:hypothetical protein